MRFSLEIDSYLWKIRPVQHYGLVCLAAKASGSFNSDLLWRKLYRILEESIGSEPEALTGGLVIVLGYDDSSSRETV